MSEAWSREWPTEPGWYWFYGFPFGKGRYGEQLPRLVPINVQRASNDWIYSAISHFLYKEEGAEGLWTPMVIPDLPNRSRLP